MKAKADYLLVCPCPQQLRNESWLVDHNIGGVTGKIRTADDYDHVHTFAALLSANVLAP